MRKVNPDEEGFKEGPLCSFKGGCLSGCTIRTHIPNIQVWHKSTHKLFEKARSDEQKRKDAEPRPSTVKPIKIERPDSKHQLKLFETAPSGQKWAADDMKSRQMDLAILKIIACDCLPLSYCESSSFRELLSLAQPRYQPKDHRHMTRLMEIEFNLRFEALKVCIVVRSDSNSLVGVQALLREQDYISFSTDLWSSQNSKHSFLSVLSRTGSTRTTPGNLPSSLPSP